jgi:hypothetical protein
VSAEHEARVLAEVQASKWRSEVSLCRQFGGSDFHTETEDALFALVKRGDIIWFGRDDKPLNYRATGRLTSGGGK